MLSIAYVIAFAASAAANPATAGTSQPVSVAAKVAKEKKICRREVSTGSVMPKSVCRTKSEWDAATAQSTEALDKARSDVRSRSMVGNSR